MAIPSTIIGWLGGFKAVAGLQPFLTSFFTFRPENIKRGETVAYDVEREGRPVAVAVKRYRDGNKNDFTLFTNKELTPASYNEEAPLNMASLNQTRPFGEDPFTASSSISYTASMVAYITKVFAMLLDMIRRGVEIQASQILQTGQLSLTDKNGVAEFDLDFFPKATHFPTVGTLWSVGGADPLADIRSLADVIVADGRVTPSILIFGSQAWSEFSQNAIVTANLDNRRVNEGTINPGMASRGGVFKGTFATGVYNFEMWLYNGSFDEPNGGANTFYVDAEKVIMLSPETRLITAALEVVDPLPPNPQTAFMQPPQLDNFSEGYSVKPKVYPTANGDAIIANLKSNILLIPVGIDEFGCLST